MEGYYSALESDNDLWYNAADVQLIYSTASEGGGQFRRPTSTRFLILNSVTHLENDFLNWLIVA